MSEWTAIIDDLTAYLRWCQERGIRTEEFDPATLQTLQEETRGKTTMRNPAAGTASPGPAQSGGLRMATGDRSAADESPAPEIVLPADTAEGRLAALTAVAQKTAACKLCVLCEQRKQTVPGQGKALSPDILFIGEAPGADEDEQGLAFVGKAGQLLTKMIAAMGYARDEVFIANICKCRPPGNRPPAIDEMQACLPYLRAQIAAIRPKVIVALGATAVKGLLNSSAGISRLRGTWTAYAGIPLMPTYHPAYLLRFPPAKKDAWDDLKKVLVRLGKTVPQKTKTEV